MPLLLAPLLAASAAAAPAHPQHLLMVVIDDLGFDDMGYANGGQIQTPNFNRMHDRGIALSQYYVQPSCSPTRATLLTGRKPVHTGINFWIPNAAYGLPLNETTLPQVLNARGFRSHAVGKVRSFAPLRWCKADADALAVASRLPQDGLPPDLPGLRLVHGLLRGQRRLLDPQLLCAPLAA